MSEINDDQPLELVGTQSDTKKVSVGIVLVALYAVLALIPMSGFIGAAGFSSILSFAVCISPLIGIILGPWRGFGFGLIAGVVATIFSLPIGGGVYLQIPTTIIGPALAALITGLCLKKITGLSRLRIPGPIVTAIYLIIVIVLYEIRNYNAWWFMLPYGLALGVSLILQVKDFQFNQSLSRNQLLPLTFIGAMIDHSMMVIGSVYILELPADLFGFIIFPVMLIERIIATLIASLLGFIVLRFFSDEIGI